MEGAGRYTSLPRGGDEAAAAQWGLNGDPAEGDTAAPRALTSSFVRLVKRRDGGEAQEITIPHAQGTRWFPETIFSNCLLHFLF